MSGSSQPFDAAKYKQSQHDQWNQDAAAWHRSGPILERWFGEVTRTMLDLADVQPHQGILDIASGAGEPALSAAERAGPTACVLATDLSENIIQFASQVAADRQLQSFAARAMDGENLKLPDGVIDTLLCRFGLMFMPDRQRALAEWRRVLKPGGRAVVAVFSTADKNGWGALPMSIIRQRAQVPPPLPGQPGLFSLGGEGVLEDALRQAGYREIEIRKLSTPLRMQSAAEYVRVAREAFGAFNQMMAHLTGSEREAVWDEVEVALRGLEGPHGFEASCEPIVAAAVS
jgi:SAM-dependent methyltransferase